MSPFITISAQRCLVVAILLLGGVAQLAGATPALAASLVDLPAGHWAYQSVNELITAGLIPGYTESSFRPGRTITRFEMAILLTRLLAQLDVKAGGDRNEVLESTGLNLAAAAKKVELSQLLATYERHGGLGREAHPKLTPELKSAMKRLFAEFGPELGVLGYEVSQESIPGSVSEKDGILQLALKAIEFFRIRGESLIRLQSVSGEGSPRVEVSRGLPGGAAASWDSGSEQPHRLQLSGVVAGGLMVDASLETTQSGFGDVDIVSFSEAYGAREVPVKLSLGALYLGAGNRVITRFGELPETTLSEFSFYRQQGLQGVQAVVELGNIGSTVIMARRSQKGLSASDSGEFVAVLDGTIQLSDTTTLAATLVSTLPPAGGAPGAWLNPSSTVASVGGTFVASPLLTLSGEYAQNASGLPGGSAVRVGAAMKLGDVQVGAQYRTVQPGFKASLGKDEPGDSLGVGLTVKVGDVVVTTQRDQSWKDLANKLETSTSVGFRYDVAGKGAVSAGYEYVDLDDLVSGGTSGSKSKTTVDLNWAEEGIGWNVALSWEGGQTGQLRRAMVTTASAGVEYKLLAKASASASVTLAGNQGSSRTTTSLGLQYELDPSASILVGYKLIDFAGGGEDYKADAATAQFTIRF